MVHLYGPQALDTARWPDSFWRASVTMPPPCAPLQGSARADVAIIGAGYAGLNAALELVERHGADVAVLEAGQPGWGASGRNGGFCCAGSSKLSMAQITRRIGAGGADAFAAFQLASIDRVADNLHRYGIDADKGPDGEVQLAHSHRARMQMRRDAAADDTVLTPTQLHARGMGGAAFAGGVYSAAGFSLHPMKYALGLAQAAQRAGVRLWGDSRVHALHPSAGGWTLQTDSGTVQAGRVLIATNGYTDESLPGWLRGRILPVISTILVTRPLSQAEQAAQGWTSRVMAYDSRRLLHYFRLLPCGRFLFGARGGFSCDPAALDSYQRRARRDFEQMFPGFATADTDHAWSGLVCLTSALAPFAGAVPGAPGLHAALGWHGNGVAAASEAGRRIAADLTGGRAVARIPDLLRRPPPRIPVPRRLALQVGMAFAQWRDGPLRTGAR